MRRAAVAYEKHGAIATAWLDRPEKLNAYDVAMRDDLFAALGAADQDPEVRVLLLRGRGASFSSGGDLAEFGTAPSPIVARTVRWQRDVWGRLLRLRAATVAVVHGWAVGGGMEMAMLCDLCLAAAAARFALPETGLAMIPGVGGTQTLPRRAGVGGALDLTLTGRTVDAATAARLGVVTQVVPGRRLAGTADGVARRLATLDVDTIVAIRRCVRAAHDGPLDATIALERRVALGLQAHR